MRRFFSSVLAVTVFASLGLFVAAPAHAATSPLDYTVSSSDPATSNWPSRLLDCSDFLNWSNPSRNAVQQTASVEVSGDYQFQDLFSFGDGYIAVFEGPFNPADVSNCIVAIDDDESVTLDKGTNYTFLLAGKNSALGSFSYSVSGPGEFASPGKAASLIEVSAVPALVTVGDPVDLAATVTSDAPWADLSGTAEFFADGSSIGTATVTSAGRAELPSVVLPAGTHSIAAVYSGNVDLFRSTSLLSTVTVEKIATTTTLAVTPNQVIHGDTAVLSASVTGANPTGAVEFYANGNIVGSAPLNGGVATLPLSTWSVGSHSLTAVYLGDPSYGTSATATPLTLVVNAKAVTPSDPEKSAAPSDQAKPVVESLANTGAETPSMFTPIAAAAAITTGLVLMISRRRAAR